MSKRVICQLYDNKNSKEKINTLVFSADSTNSRITYFRNSVSYFIFTSIYYPVLKYVETKLNDSLLFQDLNVKNDWQRNK